MMAFGFGPFRILDFSVIARLRFEKLILQSQGDFGGEISCLPHFGFLFVFIDPAQASWQCPYRNCGGFGIAFGFQLGASITPC